MKINGWDVSEAGARQLNVTFGTHSITNVSEWSRGSPAPVLLPDAVGFKTLDISWLVRGSGREDIRAKCSQITARLLEPVELILDGCSHRFRGILAKQATLDEKVLNPTLVAYNRAAKLTARFNCYEYGTLEDGSPYTVTETKKTEITVNNPGNLLTPAVIEITPQIGVASLSVSGICQDPGNGQDLPVQIGTLESGKMVVLDGESGLMTQDGELKTDLEIWGLPVLKPGKNTITLDSDRMAVTVKFYPRYV